MPMQLNKELNIGTRNASVLSCSASHVYMNHVTLPLSYHIILYNIKNTIKIYNYFQYINYYVIALYTIITRVLI